MPSTTSQGTRMAISAAAPATFDAAGYTALTYTTIKGLEAIPAFGATTATNAFQPLDGDEEKHKGPTSNGSLEVSMAYDSADAGQTLLQTAAAPENNAEYTLVITLSNGDKGYSRARVFGSQLVPGSATNVLMLNSRIEFNRRFTIVKAT